MENRKCDYCKAEFTPNRSWAKYCPGKKCQEKACLARFWKKKIDVLVEAEIARRKAEGIL